MTSRPAGNRTCLYDSASLLSVIEAMSLQAAGMLAGAKEIMLVGVLRRGAPLADMLYEQLTSRFNFSNIKRMNLKIKRYGDDLQLLYPETLLTEAPEHLDLDLSGVTVLVVDDVMYGGHSMLRAVDYLARKNAEVIRTAVLVDRGVTRLPICSDITGLRLDVAPADIIECNVPPYESTFKIEVLQPGISS